jgi:hypothetical protein
MRTIIVTFTLKEARQVIKAIKVSKLVQKKLDIANRLAEILQETIDSNVFFCSKCGRSSDKCDQNESCKY